MKKYTLFFLLGMICCMLCACKKSDSDSMEQAAKEQPVKITLWHYFNDAQNEGIEQIIDIFNKTEGAENNITVEAVGQGSIDDIEMKLDVILNESSNDISLPDLFYTYRDVVSDILQKNPERLLDFKQYFSEQELERYNSNYINEGMFHHGLYIMPVAKSTELLFVNDTEMSAFFHENDEYSRSDFSTWESLSKMAEAYYNWTDNKTPDTPYDGKALMGLDDLSNYFIAQNEAMGSPIYQTDKNGQVTFHLDRETIDRLFINYYIPFTRGYYGAGKKYRSDDLKRGTIAGYIGSVASMAYFPDSVFDQNNKEIPITMAVYPYPYYENGEKVAIQQGAGLAAFAQDDRKNHAIAVFVKWLLQKEAVTYAEVLSYMPVSTTETDDNGNAKEREIDNEVIKTGLAQVEEYKMVYGFDFQDSYQLRKNLEVKFKESLEAGRKEYQRYLEAGMTREQAEQKMDYEKKADDFYFELEEIFKNENR